MNRQIEMMIKVSKEIRNGMWIEIAIQMIGLQETKWPHIWLVIITQHTEHGKMNWDIDKCISTNNTKQMNR